MRDDRAPDSSARWSLVVAILGSAMAFLDGTVVNVALPVMQSSLGGTVSAMQWIVEAYAVVLASLVLVGGALGDRLGRRRVFTVGTSLFVLASLGCAAAPTAPWLVAARALQGLGASMLVPGSLSLISAAYPESQRGKAIGTWSASSAIITAVGPVAGGWVTSHASWRWLFLFNVPLGLVTVLLARTHVVESRDRSVPPGVDVPGAILAALGLGFIVFGLVEAPSLGGATSPRALGLILTGVLTLVLFVRVEARSVAPMVPLSLFRSATFTAANALTLFLYAALGGALFFLPFELVQVHRYTPGEAGAALLPMALAIATLSPVVGSFAARHGARLPLVLGPLLAAAGFLLLGRAGAHGTYWRGVFPAVCVLGLGMGITVAPLTTAVMGSAPERYTGAASGLNNAVARAAAVLAIAALGAVLTARFDRVLDASLEAIHPAARAFAREHRAELAGMAPGELPDAARLEGLVHRAFMEGFQLLVRVCAALAALGSVLSALFVRKSRARPGEGRA